MHGVISIVSQTCSARKSIQRSLERGLGGGGVISHRSVELRKQRNHGSAEMACSMDLHGFAWTCPKARMHRFARKKCNWAFEFMDLHDMARKLHDIYIYIYVYVYMYICNVFVSFFMMLVRIGVDMCIYT